MTATQQADRVARLMVASKIDPSNGEAAARIVAARAATAARKRADRRKSHSLQDTCLANYRNSGATSAAFSWAWGLSGGRQVRALADLKLGRARIKRGERAQVITCDRAESEMVTYTATIKTPRGTFITIGELDLFEHFAWPAKSRIRYVKPGEWYKV